MPTLANYISRPIWQVPGWYVATLGSTGFQIRATVVEGGTLVLGSSKPWVASLGPLTVLKAPSSLAPLRDRQDKSTVGCCVTGDRLPSPPRVTQSSTPQPWPLAFDVATQLWLGTGHRARGGRCPPLICPTRPLSTEGPVGPLGPLGHERPRVYGVW